MLAIIIIIVSQLLFSLSDFMGRYYIGRYGFNVAAFITPWFLIYTLLRTVATFGQLYAFTQSGLGRTMALFGAVSIVMSNLLGWLLLGEILAPWTYVGISLAIFAFLIIAVA
jgi:drug/metabolite transporter superfamily protein YnfA